MSSEYHIPLIATQEVFYLTKNMHEAHDALVCIGQKNFVNETDRVKYSDQHYFKNNEEMFELFKDIPEALENNSNFPYRFNFKPKKSAPVLPTIRTKENVTVEQELLFQAKEGLKNRMKNFILKKSKNTKNNEIFKLYEDRLIH